MSVTPAGPKRDQARTRLARGAVVDAARRLFLERGYGATTMEAISAEADVPPATVYRLFSSKHGIEGVARRLHRRRRRRRANGRSTAGAVASHGR